MTVYYEWDVEERDEHGDAQEHNHCGSYAECLSVIKSAPAKGVTYHVALVRDNDCTRVGQRSWAYMEDRALPSMFTDAMGGNVAPVPARFYLEVFKAH